MLTDFCGHVRSSADDPTFLSFKKGELIIIIKDDEFSEQRGWIKGQSESTRQTGAVPTEAILILPTLSKPTNAVMVQRRLHRVLLRTSHRAQDPRRIECFSFFLFFFFQSLLNLSPNQRENIIRENQKETGTMERLAPATLREFSLEYFRYLELPNLILPGKRCTAFSCTALTAGIL